MSDYRLPQPQPLPAGDFRCRPAELRIQVDIAEGEQLHEAGSGAVGRRFALRGLRRFRFGGAGRVGTARGVCGAIGREMLRGKGGFRTVDRYSFNTDGQFSSALSMFPSRSSSHCSMTFAL